MSSSSSSNRRQDNARFRQSFPRGKRKGDYDASSQSSSPGRGVKAGPKTTSSVSSSMTSNQKNVRGGRLATLGSWLVPETVAKVAVPVYLFTVTATWVLGVGEVAPTLYPHPPMLLFQRVVMTVLYLQMMLNWLCIRYVDSSYLALLKARWTQKQARTDSTERPQMWRDRCGQVAMWLGLPGWLWEQKLSSQTDFGGREFRSKDDDLGDKPSESGDDAGEQPTSNRASGTLPSSNHSGQAESGENSTVSQTQNENHDKSLSSENVNDEICSSQNETSDNVHDLNLSKGMKNSEKGILLMEAEIIPKSSNKTENDELRSKPSRKKEEEKHDCSSQETNDRQTSSKLPWKPDFHPPAQTTFPYWSWAPCYICHVLRPPRCHHCTECNTCVLKRDHHCYFAGNCVGFKNQRHFLIFGAWAFFSCCYATSHAMPYLSLTMWSKMRWFDLLAPVTVIRWLLGYVSGLIALNICVQTLLFYFTVLSLSFVVEHVDLITKSLTSFEIRGLKKTVELRDSRDMAGRFRAVLGRNWFWNILCPLHWVFEAEEDPEHWPSITFIRH